MRLADAGASLARLEMRLVVLQGFTSIHTNPLLPPQSTRPVRRDAAGGPLQRPNPGVGGARPCPSP